VRAEGLGSPKAALLGFCGTWLAYNVLASGKAALRSLPGRDKVEEEVSLPKVSEPVSRNYEEMRGGRPAGEWLRFRERRVRDRAECLRQWAARGCLEKVKKAKSRPRKKGGAKPVHDPSTPQVSTARLLAARRQLP